MDELEKIQNEINEEIMENEKVEIPDVAEAVVTDVTRHYREELNEAFQQYGRPEDPFITIHFDVVINGGIFDTGQHIMALTPARNGAYARYCRLYGIPEEGQEIKVMLPENSDFWRIVLKK